MPLTDFLTPEQAEQVAAFGRAMVAKGHARGVAEGESRVLTGLKAVASLNGSAARVLKGEWDESQHPRDHGKFAEKPGGGSAPAPLEDDDPAEFDEMGAYPYADEYSFSDDADDSRDADGADHVAKRVEGHLKQKAEWLGVLKAAADDPEAVQAVYDAHLVKVRAAGAAYADAMRSAGVAAGPVLDAEQAVDEARNLHLGVADGTIDPKELGATPAERKTKLLAMRAEAVAAARERLRAAVEGRKPALEALKRAGRRYVRALDGMAEAMKGAFPGRVGKAWDESQHPRDHGKFSEKEGEGKGDKGDAEPSRFHHEETHEELTKRAGALRAAVNALRREDVDKAEFEDRVSSWQGKTTAYVGNRYKAVWRGIVSKLWTDFHDGMHRAMGGAEAIPGWGELHDAVKAAKEKAEADVETLADYARDVAASGEAKDADWFEKHLAEMFHNLNGAHDPIYAALKTVRDHLAGGKASEYKLGRYFKSQWDESQHPRDHGQFSEKPGGEGAGDSGPHKSRHDGVGYHDPADRDSDDKATDKELKAAREEVEELRSKLEAAVVASGHVESLKALLAAKDAEIAAHNAEAAAARARIAELQAQLKPKKTKAPPKPPAKKPATKVDAAKESADTPPTATGGKAVPKIPVHPDAAKSYAATGQAAAFRLQDDRHPLPEKSRNDWAADDEEYMPGVSGYANMQNALADLVFGEKESATGENYSSLIRKEGGDVSVVVMQGKSVDAPGAEVVVPSPKVAAVFRRADVERAFLDVVRDELESGDKGMSFDDVMANYRWNRKEQGAILDKLAKRLQTMAGS